MRGKLDLAISYYNGDGIEKNQTLATQWFENAAQDGLSTAMTRAGVCYLFGFGVPADKPRGLSWLRRAADLHDPDALFELGQCYEIGIGVAVDAKKAVKFYEQAAEGQNISSMVSLGDYYRRSTDRKSEAMAFSFYRKAAEAGDAYGMRGLGQCYFRGVGTTKSIDKAMVEFTKSADLGNASALLDAGDAQFTLNKLQAAYSYYQKAADKDLPAGFVALGICCAKGWGVPQDWKIAITNWRRASQLGDARGEYLLAIAVADGTYAPFNQKQISNLLRKSSEAGYALATQELKEIQSVGWEQYRASYHQQQQRGGGGNIFGLALGLGNWASGMMGDTDTRDPVQGKMEDFHAFTGN